MTPSSTHPNIFTHNYDPVFHTCVGCGVHRQSVSQGYATYECHATPNVTGITHRILQRRQDAALKELGLEARNS